MKKRIISFMLILLMILTSVPVEAFGHQSRNVNPNKEAEAKYNVVNINGQKYKAYKISDIMPDNLVKKQSQKRAFNSGLMRTSGYVDQTETDPNKLWTLKINWETRDIDFPNETIIFPVIYNPDGEENTGDEIELGIFEVDAAHAQKGNSNERIKMKVKEGINPNDYIEGAEILCPHFIKYDLRIVKNNEWNGHEYQEYQFLANVSQNVMSVYKISWFDNDSSKRQEFEGKWKGSKSIETDLVGSTEDGYYTVIKELIGRKDLYTGNNKPYTPSEGHMAGELKKGYKEEPIQFVNLNIDDVTPVDTAGSYIIKDGVETQKGFLQLGTKYYYNITGDYRTLHEIELREELKVKFDPNGATFAPAVKTEQAIGHSMKIGEAFGDLEAVTVPTKNQISNIPQKDNKDQEFVGWVVDETNKSLDFSDGKNADKLVNPQGYEVKKNVTFYAVYAPKAQGKVAIQYVDTDGNAIQDTYKIATEQYPDKAEGNVGEDVDINKIPEPVFYGYERTDKAIDVSGKKYQNEHIQTVEVEYKKLADIIPEKGDDGKDNPDANKPEVKNYYKKVVYKADKAKGYLGEEAKNAEEVVYYVNPVAGKKVSDTTAPNVGAKTGYLVDDTKWAYPQGITTDTEITKDTASPIVINANFKKQTTTKEFTKTWAAEAGAKLPDPKPSVTFELYADDVKVTDGGERILSNGALTAEYKDLVKYNYDNTGKATTEIKYTVKEKGEANSSITLGNKTYAVEYTDAGVKNTLGKEVISLTAKKVWDREDGAAKLPETKPTLTFDLYKDGNKVDGQSKTLENGTKEVKWTGLDKYKADGVSESAYTVKEAGSIDNGAGKLDTIVLDRKTYEVQVSALNNGVITVTNTLKKETTDVEFTKAWAAADGTTLPTTLPEVTFVLVKDGTETTTTAKVDSTTNKAKFSGLDKYTKGGDEIVYTVKEQGEDKGAIKLGGKDYTVTYSNDGKTVTNTLQKELVEVKATKTWTVASGVTALTKNPDVKLQLLADGAAVSGKEVAVDANGEANFGKLAKYQANGTTEIKYTVKEVGEADGKITIDGREYKVTYDDLKVTNELQAKEVKVSYEFVTDKGAKITEEKVNEFLNPEDDWKATAKEGEEVSAPTTPVVGTKVEIKKGTPEKLIGTYTFKEWRPVKVTAGTEDIKFVGVWEYVGEFYPRGKDITVQVGETPDPKDGIENRGEAPDGTDYKFKKTIDTTTPGDKKATIVVTIPNPENLTKPRIEEVEITVHVNDLRCITPAPQMNPVYDSDEYITGRGIPGAVIEVRYRDYPILRTKVDTFGEWEVYTPYPLEDEQFVYARQIKEPCDPSVWVSEEIRYDYEYWRKDDKKEEPKKPVEIKKVWTPAELNARDHFSYIKGYGDNTFGPNRTITRAEVAMIFARLSINQSVSGAPQFKDVKAGDWYKTAVDIVARQGVVKGYEDGTFRPNQPITRREFAAIAARYAGNIDTWRTFRDVPSTDWAYTLINRVGGAGWITGYEDNTFRPNNNITRAEVVAIVNRMLNRKADKAYVDNNLMRSKHSFIDNLRSAWYFYDIHEAAVGHSFERQPNGVDEKWNRVNGQAFEIRER